MLRLIDFKKSYGDTLILKIPLLELPAGIHWIKGENGSGKSTLFKCIAGQIPFEGDIHLGELNQKKAPIAFRKQTNFAEAEPLYPGFLTSKDLVRFIGKTKEATIANQQALVQQFGVDSFFEKPCETYSSGMLKKLSLAMAFLGSPSLIILDEPIITLDEHSRNVLYSAIEEYRSKGVSFMISSHQDLGTSTLAITSSYRIVNKELLRD
jgi:ABC-2 type transport system ATP-binding protein